jgi:hypothetical protein
MSRLARQAERRGASHGNSTGLGERRTVPFELCPSRVASPMSAACRCRHRRGGGARAPLPARKSDLVVHVQAHRARTPGAVPVHRSPAARSPHSTSGSCTSPPDSPEPPAASTSGSTRPGAGRSRSPRASTDYEHEQRSPDHPGPARRARTRRPGAPAGVASCPARLKHPHHAQDPSRPLSGGRMKEGG